MTTLATLRAEVIRFIGEVSGTSVQTYSEPRVDDALKQAYLNLFRKMWWPEYMKWFTLTLSGANGIHTDATFSSDGNVQKSEDIRSITISGQNRPLPKLPYNTNPYNITGTRPVYWEAIEKTDANAGRLFRVWPLAATGTLYVNARVRPATIDSTVNNYMDDNLLVFGAAWLILEQEDINANAAALAERMFTETFADINKAISKQQQDNPHRGSQNQAYLSDWSLF